MERTCFEQAVGGELAKDNVKLKNFKGYEVVLCFIHAAISVP